MNYNILNSYNNTFHLVSSSPFPLQVSNSLFLLMIGVLLSFQNNSIGSITLQLGLILTIINILLWISDIIREATFLGDHTSKVEAGLSMGFILFIVSEALLFFSVFWALFHSSLAPTVSIGCIWPPLGITAVSAFDIPLLNSVILFSSSISITVAHYAYIANLRLLTINYLIITMAKALYFVSLQYYEYTNCAFTITDSVYGSVFYALTGLHGLHVIVGFLFILVASLRIYYYHNTDFHHLGFIVSILYWHFVDALWAGVYTFVYLF